MMKTLDRTPLMVLMLTLILIACCFPLSVEAQESAKAVCQNCGTENIASSKFCKKCGGSSLKTITKQISVYPEIPSNREQESRTGVGSEATQQQPDQEKITVPESENMFLFTGQDSVDLHSLSRDELLALIELIVVRTQSAEIMRRQKMDLVSEMSKLELRDMINQLLLDNTFYAKSINPQEKKPIETFLQVVGAISLACGVIAILGMIAAS